jgi:anti-anti-sigma regulatory factor
MRIDMDVALVDPKPHATPLRPSEFDNSAEHFAVIHVKGPLVEGEGVRFFLEQIRLLIGRGVGRFVIDLDGVPLVDRGGVYALAAAYNLIRDARGKVKYAITSADIHIGIRKNHLDRVFEIFQNEAAALAGFAKPRNVPSRLQKAGGRG